jgi:hypothetical protein
MTSRREPAGIDRGFAKEVERSHEHQRAGRALGRQDEYARMPQPGECARSRVLRSV